MPYFYVPQFFSPEERYERAANWPWYVIRIYRALRRGGSKKSRLATWKLATNIFHCWVWGMAELPFADE